MAGRIIAKGAEKRRRSKKKKSRTEISSSSESDSEADQKRIKKAEVVATAIKQTPSGSQEATKKQKKEKKKKNGKPSDVVDVQVDFQGDISTAEVEEEAVSTQATSGVDIRHNEDFTAIYLRKITTELGDDLNKVREAQDFTAKSLPMLIHALKQGESMFSAEEKKRVAGAATG